MAATSRTKYAILGLLASGPRSGYDIKKAVDRSIGFFWNENFGHLYPILGRMEREGLVTMKLDEEGAGPVKKLYALTPRGRKEFIAWLRAPVEEQPLRNELLLKIFFSGQIGADAVVGMMRAEKEKNEELIAVFREIRAGISGMHSKDVPYWDITLDFGIRKSEMTIAWCDETIRRLARNKRSPRGVDE